MPAVLALGLLALNPHVYRAATSDFHFQALATFFVVGAGRSLWRGDRGRAWLWVAAALSTGDVAGTYVAGLGLSAAVARRDLRLTGLGVLGAGAGWVALVALIGANRGSQINGYAHLVGEPVATGAAGVVAVLAALLLHPPRVVAHLAERLPLVLSTCSTSLLGLLHPWSFGVLLAVLGPNALHSAHVFTVASFQNLPVLVFGAVGTALLVDAARRRSGRTALGAGAAAAVVVVTVAWPPEAEPDFPQPAGVAEAVAAVDRVLRPDDHVIASSGVVGRFADRETVDIYVSAGTAYSLDGGRVVVVLSPTIGNMPTPPDQRAAAASLRRLPGVETLVRTPQLTAYAWTPPPGTDELVLPVR